MSGVSKIVLICGMALSLAIGLTACDSSQYGQKQTVGGLTGAALGGLLGAQFGSGRGQLATTAVGVLLGALAGTEVGRTMDQVDRMKADQAAHQAHQAPLGQTVAWNNPDSGNSGTVTALRDGTSSQGQYCREYRQTITVAGRTEQGYGVACRQPDGTWRLLQ